MLWYKAWLETRARFLVSLLGMTGLCSFFIYNEVRGIRNVDWDYRALHFGHGLLSAMWVAAVMFLMMGGLLRESAVGAVSFTLALPVSRIRLMGVRILFGLLQALVLVIVPWGAMFLVASFAGKTTAISQALWHVVLLTGGGLVFFAVAVLVSSVVEGEYTAPAVSFAIFFADVIALGEKRFTPYSPWSFMMGYDFFDRRTQMFAGPIPWPHVAMNLLLAALFLAAAIRVVQRKEF